MESTEVLNKDISIVYESSYVSEVNTYLDLGWKLLNTSSGYSYIDDPDPECMTEKRGYVLYSLAWLGDKESAQFPEPSGDNFERFHLNHDRPF